MITVTKKPSLNGDWGEYSLFISFPYDADIVSKVKSLKERKYDPNSKSWEVPTYSIKRILDLFEGYELSIDENVNLAEEKPLSEYEKQVMQGGTWTIFKNELQFIKNKELRDWAIALLDKVPKYFFIVPASSTGKYHPAYTLGEGGLVRHTKAAMKIANELLNNNTLCGTFTEEDKDIVLLALLFHDSVKHGKNDDAGYTTFTHPLEASDYIFNLDVRGELPSINAQIVEKILGCIESHMGEWNTPYKADDKTEPLPLPKSKLQKITHICDYLASRKFLEVLFEEE